MRAMMPGPALADTRLVLSKAGSVAVRITCKAVRCTGTVAVDGADPIARKLKLRTR